MRILYHHRTLADGAEGVHIRAVAEAFRALGHEVTVLGLDPWQRASRPANGGWLSRLKAVMPVAVFELASMAVNLLEALRTARAIRRLKPHFAYKRHARYDVGTLWALRRCGVPAVLEVNSLFTEPPYVTFEPHVFNGAAQWFERRSLALASAILTVSSPLARQVAVLSNTPVHVVPNGVDVHRFDPARARGETLRAEWLLEGRRVVGWVGVIREWHGLDLLLEALADVAEATLLIVGDGPGRDRFEARAKATGLWERTVITGRVPHEEMPRYVAVMDVAVVADERTGVASPMKLLEYMAMGRAVVAPRMTNIAEIVTDRTTGLLFTPGDSKDLARCLKELIVDAGLRATIGHAARAVTVTNRSWTTVARQALALTPHPGDPD